MLVATLAAAARWPAPPGRPGNGPRGRAGHRVRTTTRPAATHRTVPNRHRPPPSEAPDTDTEHRRRDREPASVHNDHTATCAALVAVLLAAAAGWAVLPDAAVPVRLLVAAAAAGGAAALGLLAVRRPDPALVGVIVAAVPVGAAACFVLRLPVPATSAAVGVSASALVAGPLLPRAALWLSGMPRPVVPADAAELVAADDGPDLLPTAELVERAELARGYLAGLVGGSALLAGAAALPAAALPGWTGPAFAAVGGGRARAARPQLRRPGPGPRAGGQRAADRRRAGRGPGLDVGGPARPVAALGLLLAAATFLERRRGTAAAGLPRPQARRRPRGGRC